MLKKGDPVRIKAGRDKIRYGTYVSSSPDGEHQVDVGGITANVSAKNLIRPDFAVKHDTDKPRLDLIPPEAIIGIGKAMTFGAKKYDDNNWRNGFKWGRLMASTLRHGFAWLSGEDNDPESGLSHLHHMGATVCMLIAHVDSGIGEDDRWKS